MSKTTRQFQDILNQCRQLFIKKNEDYGTAWQVLRPSSITDQIYIKAARIRSIDTKTEQKVNEPAENEFIGIVNYCLMAMISIHQSREKLPRLLKYQAMQSYDKFAADVFKLMEDKNHDYDEIWRKMRVSSMTDLILMKLIRIKEIEDKEGLTVISRGLKPILWTS